MRRVNRQMVIFGAGAVLGLLIGMVITQQLLLRDVYPTGLRPSSV
ncbi:MAG: hypothetical protein ACRD4B_02665 [Acidobacteriota bacterium]